MYKYFQSSINLQPGSRRSQEQKMTLVYKKDNCCLIDHNQYISKLYTKVKEFNVEKVSFKLRPSLFCIRKSKRNNSTRKRRKESSKFLEETVLIKQMHEKFLKELPSTIKDVVARLDFKSDVGEVRDLSKLLFEQTVFDHKGLNGGNTLDKPLKCTIQDEEFLVPQLSSFYCGDVREQCEKLKDRQFQLIVADPPWWNKYIRRLKAANDKLSYSMMYNEDIAAIPIKDLLSPNSLVAVWCTNAPSNIAAVKDLIFPKWGVQYVTTWYWLKVTTELEPLCEFGSGSQKQPYERIIIGKVGSVKEVMSTRLIVSVPSALHSHKPPLLDVLTPCLQEENPQTLEVFARYLLPNTTSVGYEPLKWQHLSLYEAVR